MASFFLSQSPTITNFVLTGNQNPDVFIVDTGVPSSRLRILQSGSNVIITDGTRTATLQNFAIGQITRAQFTNNDGSAIGVGDDTTGVPGDAGVNLIGGYQTAGGDLLIGLGGDDTAGDMAVQVASPGNDYIVGNAGNDFIAPPASDPSGNDTVLGGQGNDVIEYSTSLGAQLLSGNLGDDTVVGGVDNDTIFGGQGNDNLDTQQGDNVADGGLGLDAVAGGAGNDTLRGGDGEDTIAGNGGSNVLSGQQGDDIITAAGANDTVFGGQGADIVDGTGVTGNGALVFLNLGNDSITGGAVNDTINGGQGNDTIQGGLKADVLTGGLGNDRFQAFIAPGATSESDATDDAADTITDFLTGSDKIAVFQTNGTFPIVDSGNVAGTSGNYREFADTTVTSVATAFTSYIGGAVSLYTFIAGPTDGYLVVDTDTDSKVDGIFKLSGLNTTAGFDFTDIV